MDAKDKGEKMSAYMVNRLREKKEEDNMGAVENSLGKKMTAYVVEHWREILSASGKRQYELTQEGMGNNEAYWAAKNEVAKLYGMTGRELSSITGKQAGQSQRKAERQRKEEPKVEESIITRPDEPASERIKAYYIKCAELGVDILPDNMISLLTGRAASLGSYVRRKMTDAGWGEFTQNDSCGWIPKQAEPKKAEAKGKETEQIRQEIRTFIDDMLEKLAKLER